MSFILTIVVIWMIFQNLDLEARVTKLESEDRIGPMGPRGLTGPMGPKEGSQ